MGIQAMRTAGGHDFLIQPYPAPDIPGAYAAGTHRHHIPREVFAGDFMEVQETKQQIEIGGNAIVQGIHAVLFVALPFDIKRGMSRHEAEPEQGGPENSRGVITYTFPEVRRMDEMDIAVHGIDRFLLEK